MYYGWLTSCKGSYHDHEVMFSDIGKIKPTRDFPLLSRPFELFCLAEKVAKYKKQKEPHQSCTLGT